MLEGELDGSLLKATEDDGQHQPYQHLNVWGMVVK